MYNVILATYNEAENIDIVVKTIHSEFTAMGKEYQIVIVDDGSPDGTYEKAESLSKVYNIKLIRREKKLGLGTAYAEGLKVCVYDYVFIMDADLSHDPKHLPAFINTQKTRQCDIVFGTRYGLGGGVYGWSFLRKMMSRGANNVAQVALGLKASDVTSSYRLYRRDVLSTLLTQATSIGYSIQMELAYLAEKGRFSIAETPIFFVNRMMGASKCGMQEVVYFVVTIVVLFARP